MINKIGKHSNFLAQQMRRLLRSDRIEHLAVDVAPAPGLTRLLGTHDGVAGFHEVAGGVLVLGVVAAAGFTADHAHPQVYPGVSGLLAFFAAFRVGAAGLDVAKVGAGIAHGRTPNKARAIDYT